MANNDNHKQEQNGQRRGGKRAASEFLLKRGLFLVVLELTLVNFAWTFSLKIIDLRAILSMLKKS